jgi:uridine kinase
MKYPFFFFVCLSFFSSTLHSSEVLCIGIAGGTASGKTTLALQLLERFPNDLALISSDNYYKDFSHLRPEERERINFDHPDAYHFDLLITHLLELKKGQPVEMPTRPSQLHEKTNRLGKTTLVPPKKILVVEGILLFAVPQIRDLFDIKIFIDTPDDVRLLRRIEQALLQGRSFESIRNQYLKSIKPMQDLLIAPSRQFAHVVFPEDKPNEEALHFITARILEFLSRE